MRTAKEIRNYLKQQKWYKDFVRNTKEEFSKDMVKYITRGYNRGHTIGSGFTWYLTPQGRGYWKAIDNKFREWYNKGGVK